VAILIALLVVVLVIVLAFAVVGLVWKLIVWALIGVVIGALARLVLPGRQEIGVLGTVAAGLAGSFLGGILADVLDWGGLLQFVLAVGFAALLIALFAGSRRSTA
jgi:uncharacterized membrane protein YeaQ/YmgE (transglycosylase-associated protein family)